MIDQHSTRVDPIRFETGNGFFTSSTAMTFVGNKFGDACFSMMDDCSLVRSLGQIVASGRPLIWEPGQRPYFAESIHDAQIAAVTLQSRIAHADRVERFCTSVQRTCCVAGSRQSFRYTLGELKRRSYESGKSVMIAEVLTLAGIKHFEMPEECHQYKGRIVYRGDRITPTAIAAPNLTLWFGAMTTVACADCVQAYLHVELDGNTWVILLWELWLPEWRAKYDRNVKLTVRLVKSFSGHPQSGQLWQSHLERQIKRLNGIPGESYPSDYVFRRGDKDQHALILNVNVDGLTLAG